MTDTAEPVVIRDNPIAHTYEAVIGDTVAGILIYEVEAGRAVLTHTIVEPDFRGHGVAAALIRGTLDDIRAKGEKITVFCDIVNEFIDRNPGYADLIDPQHPGQHRS